MDSNGGVFKRCGCRDPHSGRLLGTGCPTLAQRGHGSWYFDCAVARFQGRRERIRRGGYPTRREALAARDALLRPGLGGGTTQGWTVARWLRFWLISRTSIRPSTLRSCQHHVDAHLIPHLGRLQLDELTGRNVATMFRTLAATPTGRGRPPTPGTLHRIRATLRAALNAAVREGLRSDNPARHVDLPGPRRPHAEVWTNQQITAWREQGQRPIVAVWTGGGHARRHPAATDPGSGRRGSEGAVPDVRAWCPVQHRVIGGHVNPPASSPAIVSIAWGRMQVAGLGVGKDFKLYPGGGREWDWNETGTRHQPGIQPADVEELLTQGATVVVLSQGMDEQLHVDPATVTYLSERGVPVHVLETRQAVKVYNELAQQVPVGGLFHSIC
jgi:hypothetical protein